ncbi:FG-GAP repeat domain-containing protein [Granulicella cerasi]|uniref:FG-GAP repeat domain-containing protein n=1 Tax=Granulicella cerasi TaxID=741063 RepID=A0ABW1Z9G1_9BACT
MSHPLFRFFTRSARSVALLSVACAGVASAQLRHWVAPVEDAPPATTLQTPAETYMAPYLKSHLAPADALNSMNTLQPMGQTYATTPNFGGYVNAPMFDARGTAKTSAVTVELGADFDKDGKTDVAVLLQDGTLDILMNDGNGGLKPFVSYLNPNYSTASVNVAYAADIDGDGYPDVVAFDYNNNTMISWKNLGNGTFNAAVTTALDTTNGYPNMAYVADVNGDGKADVLYTLFKLNSTTSATITLETQLGVGDGTFGAPGAAKTQSFNVASSGILPTDYGITTADINGDGKLDVAVVVDQRTASTTGIFAVTTGLGNGDGTFTGLGTSFPIALPLVSSGIRATVSYKSTLLSFADVNGDGKLDLVSDCNGIMAVALGNGTNSFATAVTSAQSVVQVPTTTVLLDVNGDGKLDAIVGGGTLAVELGKGDGTFAAPVAGAQYMVDPVSYYSLVVADFNNDGIKDIAQLGSDYKQVSLFSGNGTGGFRGAPVVTVTGDPNVLYSSMITTGKYTTGGYASAIMQYSGTTNPGFYTAVGDGKGNFTTVASFATTPTSIQYFEPIHADFNGDGLEDLVYANTTGEIYVALSKGDGTFATPVAVGIGTKPCPEYYGTAGDVNGDGKADLVIPYGGDTICGSTAGGATGYYVALGKGDGTFSTPTFHSTGSALYKLLLADLNNDGKLDLVIDDAPLLAGTGFAVKTALGNGDGTFATPVSILANYLVTNMATADFNNDGKMDIALTTEEVQGLTIATGGIIVLSGHGDNSFDPSSQIATGNWFYGLQAADMNSDGNADIIVTLYSTVGQPKTYYGVSTLLGYGNGQFAAPYNQLQGRPEPTRRSATSSTTTRSTSWPTPATVPRSTPAQAASASRSPPRLRPSATAAPTR